MKFTAYHLFFDTPVHFGIESIGQEKIEITARSDTLWGAVVQKWLLLFRDDPEQICNNSLFDVSSSFPFVKGKRFYPLPVGLLDELMNKVAHNAGEYGVDVKTLKKIRFVSETLLQKMINGHKPELEDISEATVFPFYAEESDKAVPFFRQDQRPRLRTDQLNQGAGDESFFYCTDQFFSQESGLFFLAQFADKESEGKFEAALRLLGDSGLGADRSVGRGFFHFDKQEVELGSSTSSTSAFLLLSLLRPSRKDVENGLLSEGRYSLVRRYGRAGSHVTSRFRRADCWMLEEGAMLPFIPEGTVPVVLAMGKEGENVIQHNVYRYGKGVCLPISVRG